MHDARNAVDDAVDRLNYPPLAWKPAALADELQCTRQHIYTLIKDGRLRAVKMGACTRIPHDSVQELLRGGAGS